MSEDRPGQAEPEILRQHYADVCKSHDAITDLRTKLLGLLPLAAGTGVFLVLKEKDKTLAPHLGAIGLFGFAATLGLFFYELRGMKECLQLRDCGEELERALGLREDLKIGRFQTTRPGIIGPQVAGWMIYPAVLGAWLYVSAVGFSWPQWVGLLLLALYLAVVAWGFHLARKRSRLHNETMEGKAHADVQPGRPELVASLAQSIEFLSQDEHLQSRRQQLDAAIKSHNPEEVSRIAGELRKQLELISQLTGTLEKIHPHTISRQQFEDLKDKSPTELTEDALILGKMRERRMILQAKDAETNRRLAWAAWAAAIAATLAALIALIVPFIHK